MRLQNNFKITAAGSPMNRTNQTSKLPQSQKTGIDSLALIPATIYNALI